MFVKKFFRKTSLIQWIGLVLILGSLTLMVTAVSQVLAIQLYAPDNAYFNKVEILKPIQVVPTDPPLIEPADSITEPPSTETTPSEPQATATPFPTPEGLIPDHITISSIHLFAPIIPVHYSTVTIDGQDYFEWDVPNERAVGWHDTSARLGQLGNIVLNGHNNAHGYVFANLVDVKQGDQIIVSSGATEFMYEVDKVLLLKEAGLPLSTRIQNAIWIEPTADERLTLVSCWPLTNNTHRVIVIAFPAVE